MTIIPFDPFFERLKKASDISSQIAMAEPLNINRSAITQAKNRNAVPSKWVLQLARRYNISPDWLEFGTGHPASLQKQAKKNTRDTVETEPAAGFSGIIFEVPKVAATVSAGGGSFEVATSAISTHPFPRQWLARMGRPEAMVFMDVVGNSMEPSIMDGDMVLIDQAGTNLMQDQIFAVGFEDTLYIKRVERRAQTVILHSDNPDYSDIWISGDELDSFRVIGKVVWLCRDCR